MRTYIIRRLLLMIPTIFLVTIMVFFSVRLIPGNIIDQMVAEMGEQSQTGLADVEARIRARLGLDAPVHIQYVRWLGNTIRGDLGESLWTGRPVLEEISQRMPITVELGLLAIVMSIVIAIPIGTYSAIRQDTMGDYLGRTVAVGALSLPNFWLATIIIVIGSIVLGWSPAMEYISPSKNFLGNMGQFLLPSFIMGLHMSGTVMRMQRTMMLEVLRQDYIRTAWAKGLKETVVVYRHALKNAMIPVVTIIALRIPWVIGGSVVMERIFCLPGVGLLMLEVLNKRDYTMVSGINLVVAAAVLGVNLLVDLTYAYLDPRIQYS